MNKYQVVRFKVKGVNLLVRLVGDHEKPAFLLIHGFPSSSESFRDVIDTLAQTCFVIAPDLPGFGESEPIESPSFKHFAELIDEILSQLDVNTFHLYLHDFGAVVGLHLATQSPHRIRSLIIQNANAHESGIGPGWSATQAYWNNPSPELEAQATAHLTLEGIRDQYVGGIPQDIVERIDARQWEEAWRIMLRPDRLRLQRALVFDYRNHFARFGEIAAYLQRWRPPALMIWGRHDIFFELNEPFLG